MNWIIFALISALLTSLATLTQKRALQTEHAMQFAASLAVVNLIAVIPVFFTINYGNLTWQSLSMLFVACLCGGVAILLTTKALRHMGVSEISPLFVIAPGITAVLALIFLNEKLNALQTSGIILTLVGAYMLELRSRDLLSPFKLVGSSKYIVYVFFSLFLYSISALIGKSLLSTHHLQPEAFLAFAHLYLAIIFIALYTFYHDGIRGIVANIRSHGPIIILISVLVVGHRYAEIYSTQIAAVGLVAVILKSSTLFTTIIGGRLFRESNLIWKAAACIVMIAGMFLVIS